jgi:UDP-glucose 4-epimerase
MTVLVTGGAGYIGGHMVLGLMDAGEKVVVLDNLSTGYAWAVPEGVELIVGDFGDADLLAQVLGTREIDAIAHFAAKIVVPESLADPLGYYLNNTSNARTLIECAIKAGVKHFIFSSTAAVYGDTASAPVSETTPLNPISPYGRSKLMAEWMLEDAARAHDFRYVALRYFNVAGADPQGRAGQIGKGSTHLIKIAAEAAVGKRDHVDVFGTDYPTPDGTCVRDYIHVSDLADAHVAALEWLVEHPRDNLVMNCGYGQGLSVLEVLDAVDRANGAPLKRVTAGRRAGDPPELVAANARLLATLDWRPKYADIDRIVGDALSWERRLLERRSSAAPN